MYEQSTQFLYLHKYLIGGATTFTAHLIHRMMNNKPVILRVGNANRSEKKLRKFGYGLVYQNVASDVVYKTKYPFITVYKENYFHLISKLNEKRKNFDDITLVIHDHRDISGSSLPYVKKWKLITIRKTVQHYLKNKFDLDSLFLPHPFYTYPVITKKVPTDAVSISRISFEKNTDIILRANKLLNDNQSIKLYGCLSRIYVHHFLGGQNGDFTKYYYGQFEKSFSTLSKILAEAKFVVDLSVLKHDGGGTQYTFLEAIHNGCALILHRNWLKNNDVKEEYCDFREGYNCFAVEDEKELSDLVKKNPDTSRIVKNAKKLIKRHANVDWSFLLKKD